jgi:cell division protein ZapA
MLGKVTVKINGAEYTLRGDQSDDHLFSIANFVDKKVREILWGNPKHSNTSAAVLAALTITDDLFKTKREIELLKKSINDPEERIKQIKIEYDKLKEAYLALHHELEEYKQTQEAEEEDIALIKNEYNTLYERYNSRNEEYENLIKENAYLKEQNENMDKEINKATDSISDLKDQLLENQIELVRAKKDLKDMKEINAKKRTI